MEPFPSSVIAQKTWELENNIITVDNNPTTTANPDPASDAIFYYDEAAQGKFQQDKPWVNDPHFFKRVKISALALLKMVVHARSGGTIEVMGLMQGKTDGDAIIVMDAFALPVEGTETRVNAQADAYEYMVDYSQTNKQVLFFLFLQTLFFLCCIALLVIRMILFIYFDNLENLSGLIDPIRQNQLPGNPGTFTPEGLSSLCSCPIAQ